MIDIKIIFVLFLNIHVTATFCGRSRRAGCMLILAYPWGGLLLFRANILADAVEQQKCPLSG